MCKKKDVFILSNTLRAGGAEKQSLLLAQQLAGDFRVKLIIYYGNEIDTRYKELVSIYKIDVLYLFGSHYSKLKNLFNLFRNNKNAIIFSYLATTNLINGVVGSLAGSKVKIGGIRNSKFEPKKIHLQRILHNYFLTVSIFNNYSGLQELKHWGFNLEKAVVIPNCIHIEKGPRVEHSSKKEVVILTVSRFVTQKDYLTALYSIYHLNNLLKKTGCLGIKYLIVGFGELENLINHKITELDLNECVDVIINPNDVNKYLDIADIYLSTSLFEGLSNSILEAMEFSLPIVATNVGDNYRLIKHGENGYLTDIKDSVGTAEYLYQLVIDEQLRYKMGEKSYHRLTREYNQEVFRNRYIELLKKLKIETK